MMSTCPMNPNNPVESFGIDPNGYKIQGPLDDTCMGTIDGVGITSGCLVYARGYQNLIELVGEGGMAHQQTAEGQPEGTTRAMSAVAIDKGANAPVDNPSGQQCCGQPNEDFMGTGTMTATFATYTQGLIKCPGVSVSSGGYGDNSEKFDIYSDVDGQVVYIVLTNKGSGSYYTKGV